MATTSKALRIRPLATVTEPVKAPQQQVEIRQFIPLRKRLHLPKTYQARAALGLPELRTPATWEQYLALADTCDYRVHYREGHIISFLEIEENTGTIMGEATIPHEKLVMRIGTLLSNALNVILSPEYCVLGSNAKIFAGDNRKGFNADVTVVKGEPVIRQYQAGKRKSKGITNPWLIVEVLSNSTREFDLSEKLNDYKQIPDLHQVIFFEQGKIWASTHIRTGPQAWQTFDYTDKADSIPVGAAVLEMGQVFAMVF